MNGSDLVRVIGTAANTEVKLNGAVVATLNAGDVYEFALAAGNGGSVEASEPVMVAQYLTGGGASSSSDPALALVPGSDNWLKSYRLATPSGAQAFDINRPDRSSRHTGRHQSEPSAWPSAMQGNRCAAALPSRREIVDLNHLCRRLADALPTRARACGSARDNRGERYHLHPLAEPVAPFARIHHIERVERQIVQCDPHRRRHLRRIGSLELDADVAAVLDHQQIELGAGVRRPEIGFVGPRDPQYLVERVAFPRRPRPRI